MKHSFKLMLASVLMLFAAHSFAQQLPPCPVDKDVRIGKLENGLTYYIRHNEYPKSQVDFHIVQKVGSVQEDDNQQGLAHFLEHMCFNGTKHFPGNSVVSWLESVGVKFGQNLNAATGHDMTVYDIANVPTAREGVIDSCLIILSDWADGLTLDPKEIDKERGVIHEEWRQTNAFQRILEKNGEAFFNGSKYGKRSPIGKMEVVDHFPHQVLRDYYEKWYRPDLQGIVVVGDIDADKIEAKIKETFGSIQMPANPGQFEYYTISDNDEPIFISEKDKEIPATVGLIATKYDFIPREQRNSDATLINNYMENVVANMLNERFNELTMKPDAPFGSASADMGTYLGCSTKGALTVETVANDKGLAAGMKAAMVEMKRVADHGFTAGEYDRARTEYLSRLEQAYGNRNKRQNNEYAQEYIGNFLHADPIPGIEYEYNKIKSIVPMIPVEAVNQTVKELLNGKNRMLFATAPDKEGTVIPTVDEMKQMVDEVKTMQPEAYKDNAVNEPLMSQLPTAGKIVSEKESSVLGYTEWTLSNGVRVLIKHTDNKDNEVLMNAYSEGGASLYPGEEYGNIAPISQIWALNGLSKFSYNDMQKLLSGKQAGVNLSVADYGEELSGRSTPQDLETMMQLIYLNFTDQRNDKQGFEGIRQLIVSGLEHASQDPSRVFSDSLRHIAYDHHPKAAMLNKDMAKTMDYDRMYQIVNERFANAADFIFIFCGNFDKDTLRKYVEQYIASLPADKQREKAMDDKKDYVKGICNKEFIHKTETNQAMMGILWTGKLENTLVNRIKLSIAGQLMANNLLNSVREEEGAAYSPYAMAFFEQTYDNNFAIKTAFPLNPDKREISEKMTIASLENLSKNIPESELNKMKEYMIKSNEENHQNNNYWIAMMRDYVLENIDLDTPYKETLQGITPQEMQDFVAELLKQGNRCKIVMMPEK